MIRKGNHTKTGGGVLGRGNSTCKGPEVGMGHASLNNGKKAGGARAQRGRQEMRLEGRRATVQKTW